MTYVDRETIERVCGKFVNRDNMCIPDGNEYFYVSSSDYRHEDIKYLYCATLLGNGEEILDVVHLAESSDVSVSERLDRVIEKLNRLGLWEYRGYRFCRVNLTELDEFVIE